MVVIPAKMGHINKRFLLWRLQRLGVASRADLAKSLGMSQPTAGKIADELLKLGVLEEIEAVLSEKHSESKAEASRTRLGRPGRMLRLHRTQPRFLGIQLGVSETSFVPLPVGVDEEDHWMDRIETPDSATEWVRRLSAATTCMHANEFWAILLSVPGIVDEHSGRVLFSPNLHWTEQADLPGLLREIWDAPVIVVQEERALALGHQYVDPKDEDFLLVDVGDGVGGAVVVSGRLYANPLPISGELGHTPVLGNQRRCGCGAVGCVETLVSHRGLLQSFAAASPQSPRTWQALSASIAEIGIKRWLAQTLDATAVVIAGALNVLGLRRAIITGSLTELPPAVMDYLAAAIIKGSMWARFGEVAVEGAPRRRTAGLVAVAIDRMVLPMTAQEKRGELSGVSLVLPSGF